MSIKNLKLTDEQLHLVKLLIQFHGDDDCLADHTGIVNAVDLYDQVLEIIDREVHSK